MAPVAAIYTRQVNLMLVSILCAISTRKREESPNEDICRCCCCYKDQGHTRHGKYESVANVDSGLYKVRESMGSDMK